jgi:hypothetical protein
MIRLALALLAATAATGWANGQELRPLEARSITLGDVAGIAYYTAEKSGYRLVATLAAGEAGTPIRLVATLAPGQSVMLSVPGPAGKPSDDLEIARIGDAVFVSDSAEVAKLN